MSNSKYPRGSEWRKWDLHVHSPASFGGEDYSNFVENINNSEAEVIGINDYCTLSGYERLLDFNLKKTLFPVVEFRMNNMVLDKNDARLKSGVKINFHIIFNNDREIISRIKNWLNSLDCFYEKGEKDTVGNISDRDHLSNISFDYFDVIKSIKGNNQLKDFFLVWLPYDEYGGIDNIDPDSDGYFKLGLINESHIIGSSNRKQMEFFLWKSDKYSENQIGKWLNNRKIPCIKGSDAHNISYPFGKLKDNKSQPIDKFCWIKADPTFKGLKQIIYEPEDRIFIGEEPERKLERGKIIKSISIYNSNKWFEDNKPIPLNEGLVSIIGGKGTGKTAILDLVAYATGSYRCFEKDESKSKSFLKKAFKELKNTKIRVEWDQGNIDDEIISDTFPLSRRLGKVRYLPQDFIDQLCTELGKSELEQQIENVIFQKIPVENKADFVEFDSYRDAQLKVIKNKESRVAKQIEEINSTIFDHNNLIDSKKNKQDEIRKIENEIEKLDDEMKKSMDFSKDFEEQKNILEELNIYVEKKSELENEISKLNSSILRIEEVKNEISIFLEDSKVLIDNLKKNLQLIGIAQNDLESLTIALYPDNLEQIINTRKREIFNRTNKLKDDLLNLNKKINGLNSKINIEKTKKDKIKEINESLSNLKKKKESLNQDLIIIREAEKNLMDLLNHRENLFFNYFELIFEEKEKLRDIYSPLENLLKESEEENENLFNFTVKFNFDFNAMGDEGHELIDLRSDGVFRHTTPVLLEEKLEELQLKLNLSEKSLLQADKESINNFIKNVKGLFVNKKITILSQLKERYTERDFDNWLYATKYYRINYSIKFNGIELNNLSPGLKGVALLILFLKLDKEDKRPILIDQPEENLDNRSVYCTLVKYFRNAKKRRQIIIVTHNPNLVVNTDSEQVIVADFDRGLAKQKAYICYISGSLENSFKNNNGSIDLEKQGLREHVCEILEGGKEAFEKREKKYGFK